MIHHVPKTPEKNKQASDLKIDLFDTIDQILDFSSTTTYKVLDSLIDLSFEKNEDLNSNSNNSNNSNSNINSNNNNNNNNNSNEIVQENKDIQSLISDIDSLVFDLNDIEDDLRKSCTRLYRLSRQTPSQEQQQDKEKVIESNSQEPSLPSPPSTPKPAEQSSCQLGQSFDISEVFSYDHSNSGPSSPSINDSASPISSPPLSPKILNIRTTSLNQIKTTTSNEISIKTTSAPSSPKWIHGNVSNKSSLSSSASSIKSLGSGGDQDLSSSVSTSISSSIGGSPLTLSGKLKNHIWRKSNQVGPVPNTVTKSPSSSSVHHPRSITDPSKFSFGRESIINLDSVNSNQNNCNNSNNNNNGLNNSGSFKHRSTFPGSIPNEDYKKNPTQILSNDIPVKSLVPPSSSLTNPVALSDSISSLPSPPLQSTLPCIIFDEKGFHNSDLKEELSKNPTKKRIDLENPTKVKKLKELLKNYRNRIISLHNRFSQEVEDLNERKYQQHQKYADKVRFFTLDHQYPIINLLRSYYSSKISCTIANIELDKKRNEFLKRRLKDISFLIKFLDENFKDSQSSNGGSPITSGGNSLNNSTNLLPQLNLNSCNNNIVKKNIIVYSSFFLQMEDLLDHISFSKFTKRLKVYNDKFISEKLNYKLYHLNHYKKQNEENREKIIKSIISQAKCHPDLPLYYPWDQNQEIQKSFSQIIRDSRFMEGKQIQQLLHLISDDCTNGKKIKAIDIEVFIEKFCERMLTSFHLLDGLSNSSAYYNNNTNNLNHNEEMEKEKFQKIFFLLNQLTKRSVYPEIYPLLKVILIKEVGGQSIKYDYDLCEKVSQFKTKSPRELNLLPTNFPEDYEWPKEIHQNPFHHAISTLNELAFFMVPIDLIYIIQQTINSIYSTCTNILNSLTFGENYQKILEKSSLLTANTRHKINVSHPSEVSCTSELSSSSSSESSFLKGGDSNISVCSASSNSNLSNIVAHSLSADDLIPIFIYVLMNSDIVGSSNMISHLIQLFSSELENSGEFGWCSVSFQAAISYLQQLE
ncbi:hypothetical protein CYY_000063 [Polysphondylium violaceum]|uniref:VPS9 domain-containing protein n=1 Tax=Polysphondylium violaceum TaxID=133409 RepID=A0A8J4V9F2_9MYCE|nr:hypothetical protein CYY_000063 [Polysphondylium violaceum]